MCKSYIANWKTLDDYFRTYINNTANKNDDLVKKEYTNFINPAEDQYNLRLESQSKSVNIPLVSNGIGSHIGSITLNTHENTPTSTNSFNLFALKFNKLDKDFIKQLPNLSITIKFKDTYNSNPNPSLLYAEYVFTKTSDYFASPASLISNRFDVNEALIVLTPEDIATNQYLKDRSLNPTDKLYFDTVEIEFNIISEYLTTDYIPLSNVTLTNAIEVEFENGVNTVYKDLTKSVLSDQGIEFKDKLNTKKEVSFNIPLITAEELKILERNFFKYALQSAFFIVPLGDSLDEYFNNLNFTGYYTFNSDYTPERSNYNVYNVKFKVKEVI